MPKAAVLDSFCYKCEHLHLLHNGPSSELVITPICLLFGKNVILAFLEGSRFDFSVKISSDTSIS